MRDQRTWLRGAVGALALLSVAHREMPRCESADVRSEVKEFVETSGGYFRCDLHERLVVRVELPDSCIKEPVLRELQRLPSIDVLTLSGNDVTDSTLVSVSKLQKLRKLSIWNAGISGEGLSHLASMPHLQELVVVAPSLTDIGLSHIGQITQLTSLTVTSPGMSDEGIAHLQQLHRLKTLNVVTTTHNAFVMYSDEWKSLQRDSKVTEQGIRELQEKLPTTVIRRNGQRRNEQNDYKPEGRAHKAYGRALSFIQRSENDTAIDELTKAVKLDPNYARAYEMRAWLWVNTEGTFDKAIEDYTVVLNLEPRNDRAYRMRGECFFHAGEFDKSVQDITECLRWIDGDKSSLLLLRGDVQRRRGHYQDALEDYKAGQSRQEGELEVLSLLRRAWMYATCPDAAFRNARLAMSHVKCAQHESTEGQRDSYFYQVLAAVHAEAGAFPRAVRLQNKALRLQPDDASPAFATELEEQLSLYRSGEPFRERSPKGDSATGKKSTQESFSSSQRPR